MRMKVQAERPTAEYFARKHGPKSKFLFSFWKTFPFHRITPIPLKPATTVGYRTLVYYSTTFFFSFAVTVIDINIVASKTRNNVQKKIKLQLIIKLKCVILEKKKCNLVTIL